MHPPPKLESGTLAHKCKQKEGFASIRAENNGLTLKRPIRLTKLTLDGCNTGEHLTLDSFEQCTTAG